MSTSLPSLVLTTALVQVQKSKACYHAGFIKSYLQCVAKPGPLFTITLVNVGYPRESVWERLTAILNARFQCVFQSRSTAVEWKSTRAVLLKPTSTDATNVSWKFLHRMHVILLQLHAWKTRTSTYSVTSSRTTKVGLATFESLGEVLFLHSIATRPYL